MNPLLGGRAPPLAEIARLVELAWYDGLRTGLVAGVLAGLIAGVLIAQALRPRKE